MQSVRNVFIVKKKTTIDCSRFDTTAYEGEGSGNLNWAVPLLPFLEWKLSWYPGGTGGQEGVRTEQK